MRFNCNKKVPKSIDYDWKKWFAWYPVRIDDECVWLERVQRRPIPKTYVTQDDWTRYVYRENTWFL